MTLNHRDGEWRLVSTRGSTNLSHLVLAPEAGIMEWSVSMLISSTGVCFKLDQLQRKTKQWIKLSKGPTRSCLVCLQGWTLILQTGNRRFSPDYRNTAELLAQRWPIIISSMLLTQTRWSTKAQTVRDDINNKKKTCIFVKVMCPFFQKRIWSNVGREEVNDTHPLGKARQ